MPTLPNPGESFQQAPEGTAVAVCCGVIDLGTQHESFQGKDRNVHQVMIRWELAEERLGDGRRFEVSRTYTWSMHEKSSLRRDLETWRGAAFKDSDFGDGGFEIKNILGKPCMVMVGRTAGDKAKVMGVAAMPKGVARPKGEVEPLYLWLSADEFEEDSLAGLSAFWQDKVKSSPEYKFLFAPAPVKANGAAAQVVHTDNFDDEIPF